MKKIKEYIQELGFANFFTICLIIFAIIASIIFGCIKHSDETNNETKNNQTQEKVNSTNKTNKNQKNNNKTNKVNVQQKNTLQKQTIDNSIYEKKTNIKPNIQNNNSSTLSQNQKKNNSSMSTKKVHVSKPAPKDDIKSTEDWFNE